MIRRKVNNKRKTRIRELSFLIYSTASLPTDNPGLTAKAQTSVLDEDVAQLPYSEDERSVRDRENILLALKLSNNKISGANGAAEMLGIKPTTLASRIKNMGIKE